MTWRPQLRQIKCVESKWTMFCEESKQQHLFKFTDNTHGNSAIITRLFANSVLQKIANNGLHKIFRVLWEIANNRYQNFGRSHLVEKYGKGLTIVRKKFRKPCCFEKIANNGFSKFSQTLLGKKKYGNSDFTLGSIDPPSSLLNRSHFHFWHFSTY